MSREKRIAVIVGTAILTIAIFAFLPPIPQDESYHDFADRRKLLGVPNALDVLSNFGFVIVGCAGLFQTLRPRPPVGVGQGSERRTWAVFFGAVLLVGPGSSWYHLAPSSDTLLWDRLPMAVAFMTLFSLVIGERLGRRAGAATLVPLILLGVASVLWWHVGELKGAGDLRFYAVVQYYPILALPLVMLLFPPAFTRSSDLLIAALWYLGAKLFELFDRPIYDTGGVSGHTLKHVAAAGTVLVILRMVSGRDRRRDGSSSGPR